MRLFASILVALLFACPAVHATTPKSNALRTSRVWKPFYKDPKFANYQHREYRRASSEQVSEYRVLDAQGKLEYRSRTVKESAVGRLLFEELPSLFVLDERQYKNGKPVERTYKIYWQDGQQSFSVELKTDSKARKNLKAVKMVNRYYNGQRLAGPQDGPKQPNAYLLKRFDDLLAKTAKSDEDIKRAVEQVFRETESDRYQP